MKKEVQYNGLRFEPYITKEDIDNRISVIARQIEQDYQGKTPLFVCVLSGAVTFATDLIRAIDLDCEIAFIKLKSYQGTGSSGTVKEIIGLDRDIKGRDVIIIEDIVDTGVTMHKLMHDLNKKSPSSLKIATLLHKPEALQKDVHIDYVGFNIPNKFIVGYGLDLDGLARNLPDIYIKK